jgi:tight adherence protein C
MNIGAWLESPSALWSPWVVAVLVGLAALLIWAAFAPARPAAKVRTRLDGYLDRADAIEEAEMRKPFVARVFGPLLRGVLRLLGSLAPKRNVEATELLLRQAGQPGGLSALDFFGLRLLSVLVAGGIYFLVARNSLSFSLLLRNCALVGIVGFFIPWLWLRHRANSRKNEIKRALPDVLDMLTISVEAGLAFAVLVQSSQLGVSISQILRDQAGVMRTMRRQRAEELARQASVKMVFPLVFLIFPALFVVILGPAIPGFTAFLRALGGGG